MAFVADLPANCSKATVDSRGNILCHMCKTTHYNHKYTCLPVCPMGFMNSTVPPTVMAPVTGGVCRACPMGCKNCSMTNTTSGNMTVTCIECNIEQGFTKEGTMCTRTLCLNQTGMFYNSTAVPPACQSCGVGCMECNGPMCRKCETGKFLLVNTTATSSTTPPMTVTSCVMACPSGWYSDMPMTPPTTDLTSSNTTTTTMIPPM
jgi:hypothetical protein